MVMMAASSLEKSQEDRDIAYMISGSGTVESAEDLHFESTTTCSISPGEAVAQAKSCQDILQMAKNLLLPGDIPNPDPDPNPITL